LKHQLLIALVAALLAGPLAAIGDDDVFLFRYANAQNTNDPRSVSMEFFKTELESVYHPDGGTYEDGFRASVGKFKEIFG
jgi:hypothetical protein